MKTLLAIALLFSTPAWATWSSVHTTTSTTGITCTPTCAAVTLSSAATVNDLMLVVAYSTTNVHISAVTCSAACTGTSWVFPANCAAFQSSTSGGISCAYVLAISSAATTLTVTLSGTASITEEITQYHSTAGGVAAETVPVGTTSTACGASGTPCVTPSVTLAGSADVVVSTIATGGTACSVASPFTNFVAPAGDGFGNNLNTSSGTGGSFIQGTSCPTGVNNVAAMISIAFSETSSGGTNKGRAVVY